MEEVRNTSENYRMMLKERIEKKMATMGGNRDGQLRSILERLEEHVRTRNSKYGGEEVWVGRARPLHSVGAVIPHFFSAVRVYPIYHKD